MRRTFLFLCILFLISALKGYSQGASCATATPFCTAVGTPFTYQNITTGSAGTVKCLQDARAPNWFIVKTPTPGTYVFSITQSTTPGGSPNIDVDFCAFGPYNTPTCNLTASGGGGLDNTCTLISNPYGVVEDCSYCWDPVETMTLRPTTNCQLFMVIVTNYSRTAGYITFTQTSGPATDCNITLAQADWTAPASMCPDAAPIDLSLLVTSGGTGGTWSGTGVSGSTFNPAVSGPGTFSVTYTTGAGTCPVSATHDITVASTTPTFTDLGPYCAGTTPAALPTTSNNGVTGTWNPSSITTSTAGTTTYTFTPNAGQCSVIYTMDVTVNNTGMIPTFSQLGPYCTGSFPALLPSSSIEGISGSWSPLFVNTSTAGTTDYTFTPAAGQCANPITMTIVVSGSITPTFDPLGPYCIGATTDALPATSLEGVGGTWSPSSISTASAGSTTYNFTPSGGSCYASSSMTVVVSSGAVLNISADPAQICPGQSSTLNVSGAVSYVWSPDGQTDSQITVTPASTTTYAVTGTLNGGCSGTASIAVTVLSAPVVTAFADPAAICEGVCTNLSATGATTYTWQPGNLSGANVSVCPSTTTTYTVIGNNGTSCDNSSTVTVSVTPVPSVIASASEINICVGESTALSANGATNYVWQPGNLSGNDLSVTPNVTTTYTVTGDVNGCVASGSVTINVYPNPVITFIANQYEGCEDLTVQFMDQSNFNDVSWFWDFGDGSTSNQQNPLHIYTYPGSYNVTLTLQTLEGCTASYTWNNMINVFNKPVADFVFSPQTFSILDPTIFLYDQSINANGWSWNFGDSTSTLNTTDQQNPTHTYADTGTYWITLVVSTEHGCSDTAMQSVYISPSITFFIPNAFSPNDDFENQNFIGKGTGIRWETFEMLIFDRWGKELLKTNDYEKGWDGQYMGKTVPQGVYVWMVYFKDITGKKYFLKGIVTVLL